MVSGDLILDACHTPTYDEINNYVNVSAQFLWDDINSFIQEKYKASPKITYSKCSAKPGWNVKYQKSGKSLCTLYPEKEGFVALVVISPDMVPVIEAMAREFETEVLKTIKSAKPFNRTLWLMIQVNRDAVLNNVKKLLLLKVKN